MTRIPAAALGFGAAQALAKPAEPGVAACDNATCNQTCKRAGFLGGVCVNGFCACALPPIP